MAEKKETDIVDKLRTLSVCEDGCEGRCRECPGDVVRAAADLIERLRAERDARLGLNG